MIFFEKKKKKKRQFLILYFGKRDKDTNFDFFRRLLINRCFGPIFERNNQKDCLKASKRLLEWSVHQGLISSVEGPGPDPKKHPKTDMGHIGVI